MSTANILWFCPRNKKNGRKKLNSIGRKVLKKVFWRDGSTFFVAIHSCDALFSALCVSEDTIEVDWLFDFLSILITSKLSRIGRLSINANVPPNVNIAFWKINVLGISILINTASNYFIFQFQGRTRLKENFWNLVIRSNAQKKYEKHQSCNEQTYCEILHQKVKAW